MTLIDKTWSKLLLEADSSSFMNSRVKPVLHKFIISRSSYADSLQHLVHETLRCDASEVVGLGEAIATAINLDESILSRSVDDLLAFVSRDPACQSLCEAYLFYKGFRALQAYRVSHFFWNNGDRSLARLIQSLISEKLSMDIHPASKISGGIFIDHGTGIVIGETAEVDRNVSMLHNVTLGGTGKDTGDRHPKIGEGVLLGAGAKVLGNVSVGRNSKVAAGSIVLNDIPDDVTVVGIPARIISRHHGDIPAYEMTQNLE